MMASASFLSTKSRIQRAYYAFAEELVYGVIENIDAVDAKIIQQAKNWTFERIAKGRLSHFKASTVRAPVSHRHTPNCEYQ